MTATKHTLVYDGAPHDDLGEPVNEDRKVTTGTGRAKCSCGWLSDELDTRKDRKAAHADHKANPEDNPQGVTAVTYTKTRCFFRSLGVEGAAELAGIYDGISDVGGRADDLIVIISGTLDAREAVAAALPTMWDAAYEAFRAWKRDHRKDRSGARDTAEGRKALFDSEVKFLTKFCAKYATDLQSVL